MVKKSKETKIDSNTVIIFNIKTFTAFIIGMLGIFYGFYQLVIVNKLDKMEEHYQIMYNDQKEQNRLFYEELGNINKSISSLNTSINIMNNNNKESNKNFVNPIKTNVSLGVDKKYYTVLDTMSYFVSSFR